jgi:hypothetical protein
VVGCTRATRAAHRLVDQEAGVGQAVAVRFRGSEKDVNPRAGHPAGADLFIANSLAISWPSLPKTPTRCGPKF